MGSVEMHGNGSSKVNVDVDPERAKAQRAQRTRTLQFVGWFVVSQIVAFLVVVLTLKWLVDHKGGFDWGESKAQAGKEFNFHPLLMVLGLVVINGEAIMLYRLFPQPQCNKWFIKLLHGGLQVTAFIMVVVGLVAVWDFHRVFGFADMYSLHSWIGIGICFGFSVQVTLGALAYLLLAWKKPSQSAGWRAWYLPLHQWWGLAMLIGSAATVCMGLTEKALYSSKEDYPTLGEETHLINWIGVTSVVFVMIVTYIVVNKDFRRAAAVDDSEGKDAEAGVDNDAHSSAGSEASSSHKPNGDAETKN